MTDIDRRFNQLIKRAIEGAEYGSDTHVMHAVTSLGHIDYIDRPIVFDLRKSTFAQASQCLIESEVAKLGPNFRTRVTYL
jgi:hypothetical protein